jgi:hypothetical protein
MPQFILQNVQDYINDARTLLLDKVYPYRYDDNSLLVALNLSLQTARRLRADLFVYRGTTYVPSYDSVSGEEVPIEPQFRQAIVYGLVGHALMRDQEDIQDQRATSMFSAQEYMLTGGMTRPALQGGTTPPGSPQK